MAEGNRRRSLCQVVIGFTEEANRDLIDDDASFFGDIPSSDASASDSADETIALDTTHLPVGSDDEEDLDEYDQGQPEPATALAAAAVGRDKQPAIKLSSTEDIEARRVAGCPCAGSQNCFLSVPPEILKSSRNSTEVLGDDDRRVFLSGKLDALANRGDSGHHGAHHAARSRVTYRYEVGGVKTCQAVFLYANSASRYDVHQVQAHLDAGVLTPPQHGNVGRSPWHAVSAEGVTQVRDFIRNYAVVNGLPQPAAPRGHNTPAPVYLPCITTKKLVHQKYVDAGGTVSYQTFVKLWLKETPDVLIMTPKEDVCGECSDMQSKITRARTEISRQKTVEELKAHMEKANVARDHYRACIAKAKDAIAEQQSSELQAPAYEHFTFDFAQQAHIPHHAREVGALYFKVPRRIQIFGVAAEAVPAQHNYLFDENETIGVDGSKCHGPNSVVSLLHFHSSAACQGRTRHRSARRQLLRTKQKQNSRWVPLLASHCGAQRIHRPVLHARWAHSMLCRWRLWVAEADLQEVRRRYTSAAS
eukprot:scpid56946/ scgid1023/ 